MQLLRIASTTISFSCGLCERAILNAGQHQKAESNSNPHISLIICHVLSVLVQFITERRRSLLEVPCTFIVTYPSVSLSVHRSQGTMKEDERKSNFSQRNRLSVEVVRTLVAKKSVQQKCLSYRLLSSCHCKCIQRRALEEKTLLCFWSAKMAFTDGTGAGKQSHWTPILTQCTNRKKMVLERLPTFCKSASNISHSAIASQERSACILHTVQHALTVYSLLRPPVQCSMLCML